MTVTMPQGVAVVGSTPGRFRRVRAPLAIALMVVLAVQCAVALTSPKMARASARPVEYAPAYQAPDRIDARQPARRVPGHPYPPDKDPRHC